MDYKTKLNHLLQSSILTKTPEDAHGFLAAEISRNFSDSDFVFIASNDVEMETIHQQINFFPTCHNP